MANTVISLKKSGTPSATPASLEFGELAINYADGKIFYKAANGTIYSISDGSAYAFATVNANGTLVVADTTSDIFSLEPGDFINITGDAINDKITISANLKSVYDAANAAFAQANTVSSDADEIANLALIVANLAFDKANSANVLAYDTGIGANAYASAVGLAANNAANNYANTVGISANAYASGVGANANLYAAVVGTSANAFASETIAGANTAVGAGANAFTSATIAGANTAVGAGANSYASAVGVAANTVGSAAFAKANANNGIGNSTSGQVLFNDSGISNGSSNLTFNKATGTLTTNYVNVNSVVVGGSEINSIIFITSTTNDQIIDSFANTTWRSAHYHITMNAGTDFQTTQISLIHDGFKAYSTEYGMVANANNLGIFTTVVTGNLVKLNIIPTFAETTIRMLRTTNA